MWIRANPGKSLPRSVVGIIKLTGCTKDQVCHYLYRQRKRARALVAKLPDLRKVKLGLQLEDGGYIDLRTVVKYDISIDQFTAKARIRMTMEDGKILYAKIPNLESFVEMTNQYVESTSRTAS